MSIDELERRAWQEEKRRRMLEQAVAMRPQRERTLETMVTGTKPGELAVFMGGSTGKTVL